jgi:hypothetical protein
MLLPPQEAKKRWPVILDELRPRDLRVAGETEREHQLRIVVARHTMVDCDRPFSTLNSCAARHRATIAVEGEHYFPVATEVFGVLSLQRVAGRAKALSQDVLPAAGTMHNALSSLAQTYSCSASIPEPNSVQVICCGPYRSLSHPVCCAMPRKQDGHRHTRRTWPMIAFCVCRSDASTVSPIDGSNLLAAVR